MDKARILVICRNEQILATIERLINNNPKWQATACVTDDEALAACEKRAFDLVLVGSGVDDDEEVRLRQRINAIRPGTKILQHFGGGSGLLATEINMGLAGEA
jgi:DNA-binding NarL/FixJ family response regulator